MSAMMECINRRRKNAINKIDDEREDVIGVRCGSKLYVCRCQYRVAQRADDGVYDRYHYSEGEALVLLGDVRASLKRFDEGDGDEKVNAE
jgi:hypothetical protein